jgi:hypothetical protein
MTETVVQFLTTQTPLFLIAFMGLIVAALALSFGIYLTYFLLRRKG